MTIEELKKQLQGINIRNGAIDATRVIKQHNITVQDLIAAVTDMPDIKVINIKIDLKAADSFEDFCQILAKYKTDSPLIKFGFTTVNNLPYVIQALEQDNALSTLFQNIEYDKYDDKNCKKEIFGFINSLKKLGCQPKSLEIPDSVSKVDYTMLTSLTGVNIAPYYSKIQHDLKILFQNVYSLLSQKPDNLNKETVESSIKQACEMTLSSDKQPMPYSKALRLLKDFDWHFLEMAQVQSHIVELRQPLPIKQETYHLRVAEDLHFYMVKINDSNAQAWQDWAKQQQGKDHIYGISKAQQKCEIGISGFTPSFQYYDNNETETWVAFVANQQLKNPVMPLSGPIEMAITMMTSTHSPFTSHIGIFRTLSYNGSTHKELAMQLHSFMAKATLEGHHDKEFMITTPTSRMQEIFIKALEKLDNNTFMFVGDDHVTYPKTTLQELNSTYTQMKQIERPTEYAINKISQCAQNIALSKQQAKLARGELYCPFKTELTTDGCSSFILQNKQGQSICSLQKSDIHGEFAWFFDSPYLYSSHDPMVTTELSALADLVPLTGDIEHTY